jgi:Domain of unknown function (DUF4384)
MVATLGLLSLLVATSAGPAPSRPRIELWTDRADDPYASGQGVRIHYRTEQDGYVTILRIDTDGRVRILFPREPWEDNFARGGRDYEVLGPGYRDAFYVDDYPGIGYVFAVVASDPFEYNALERNDHWDYHEIADDRVHGDPYVAVTDLARRIVPDGYEDWDYDLAPYYVERHYDYPRFLCYDCHSYASYPYWNAYDYSCVRFRIVVYDDPYYYPYRYGGTQVVFTRPLRPEPRFIFKDRQPSDLFVTRVRERTTDAGQRRDVGVRGRDLGGTGIIPPPNVQPRVRRQVPDQRDDGDRPDRPDRPDRRDRPDRGDRPDRRDQPDRPDRPDRPDQRPRPDRPDSPQNPDRPERRDPPDRRDRPDQPARPAPPERRGEPQREAPPPRSEPRVDSKREPSKDKPRSEPELRRRKP